MGKPFVIAIMLSGCSFAAGTSNPSSTDASPPSTHDAAPKFDAAVVDTTPMPNDRDGDGVLDPDDNCPDNSNPLQANEDADARGNACDNCPHLANDNQANADGDGVGDVCDPSAQAQTIKLFLPFDDAADITGWQTGGSNAMFVVQQGKLRQVGNSDLAILWKNALGFSGAWITTNVTYDALLSYQFRGVAVMTRFQRTTDFGHGVGCGEMTDTQFMNNSPFHNLTRYSGAGFQNAVIDMNATVATGQTARYTVHYQGNNVYNCADGTAQYNGDVTMANGSGTGINFSVWGVRASFDYLIVIE